MAVKGDQKMQQNKTTLQLDRYTQEARALVVGAQNLADERNHKEIDPVHLLVVSLQTIPNIKAVLHKMGVEFDEMLLASELSLKKLPSDVDGESYLSQRFIDMLERTAREADRDDSSNIDVEHLLNSLSQELRGPVGKTFKIFGLGPGAFRPYTVLLQSHLDLEFKNDFVCDLVALARENSVDPVIGFTSEIRRLLQILKRRNKNNTLIVGNPGVGKFSLIRALALRVSTNDVPSNLINARFFEINTSALVSGSKMRGELEERVKELITKLVSSSHKSIVVLKNFDTLLRQNNGVSVIEAFKPMLTHSKLQFIGTITTEGLKKLQSHDQELFNYISMIQIEAPAVDEAVEILRGLSDRYEKFHHIKIDESAIVSSVKFAKRYLQDRELPDSAIDLLDETLACKYYELKGVTAETDEVTRRLQIVENQESILKDDECDLSQKAKSHLMEERSSLISKLQNISELGDYTLSNVIDEQNVAKTLSNWTGIPVSKMLETEIEKLKKMEENLNKRVVGQDEALVALSQAVRRSRVGLSDSTKPVGSFIFLGPSGVGKTELAKALAEFLFDDEQALIRFDMSEFMEKHQAQRLLGSPPGYVDSSNGGELTEAVRKRPYSVLLFDEVEKSHPDVFNLLLQLLDDGRLTDGRGNTTDFSNTVIIMTSNIGSNKILENNKISQEEDQKHESLRAMLMTELRGFFRPEFLNRLDDIVVFHHLTKECLRKIVDIQLQQLQKLLIDKKLEVSLTDAAKNELVELGYDPAFGARPLKRALLRKVQNPLAEHLLHGQYNQGDTINVDFENNEFIFSKQ